MKAFIWRIIYAVVCVVIAILVIPLFAEVVGFPLGGSPWQLIRICIACLAVLYVFFGPQPPAPF